MHCGSANGLFRLTSRAGELTACEDEERYLKPKAKAFVLSDLLFQFLLFLFPRRDAVSPVDCLTNFSGSSGDRGAFEIGDMLLHVAGNVGAREPGKWAKRLGNTHAMRRRQALRRDTVL